MTIEFENFDDLKAKLNDMGWYLTKKVSYAIGKLNNCSKCGCKMYSYNVNVYWDDEETGYAKWKNKYYRLAIYHGIGEVECRQCGNKVVVGDDDFSEGPTVNKARLRQKAAKKWNEVN